MKIIHTADWHIGKIVHGIHMTQDQREVLGRLVEILEEERPDVLVIAGDIYDRSIPPVEAVELLDEMLRKILVDLGIPIIAVAGNHDSPDRIGFASGILKKNGLHMVGRIESSCEPIQLEDRYGRVNFYALPYVEPSAVRLAIGDESVKNHEDAIGAITSRIYEKMDSSERNVFIGHGFVTYTDESGLEEDALTCESERPLCIGGSERVDVSNFERFDYVALGHLHKAQRVKRESIRYSGSIMKYSFSEHMHKKSVACVELNEKGAVEVRTIDIRSQRDMRVIRGDIETLVSEKVYSQGNVNDYIKAELTNEGEIYDAIGKLRAIYPNVLKIERVKWRFDSAGNRTYAGADFVKKDALELFKEFYSNVSGDEFGSEKMEMLRNAAKGLQIQGRDI